MQWRRLLLASIPFLLVLVGGILYFWGPPAVVEVTPADGADPVQAGTPLQVHFSRRMQPESVTGRLSIEPGIPGQFSWQLETLVFTPDAPWPSGALVQVSLASGARAAGWLPLSMRQGIAWSFTIGRPQLLYLYPSDGPADIYRLDLQTGETTRLTSAPGEVLDFSTSPTGASIYYNTSLGDGGSTLNQLDRASGQSRPLLECVQALCRFPQISPDGRFLAYERTSLSGVGAPDIPQVWLMPLSEGAAPGQLELGGDPFLAGNPDHTTQQPLWSPSGLLTYFNATLSAFIVQSPDNGEVARFPNQTGITGDWEPQGQFYLVPEIFTNEIGDPSLLGDLESISSSHLLRYSLDGAMQDLTVMDNLEDASPAYSPDGIWLAFARKYLDIKRWTLGRQLWLMRADGSDPRPLTQEPYYNHYSFAWSPDASLLAYVRFNKNTLVEPPEIWLVNLTGSSPTRLITGGYAPQWIP